MKRTTLLPRIFFFLLFSFFVCWPGGAQSLNPCGVEAKIWPSATDSVVPNGALIDLKSVSVNATTQEWLLDGWWSGVSGPDFRHYSRTGVHTISLVAKNGACTDTTTVYYFSPGKDRNIDSSVFANYGLFNTFEYGKCMDATADGGFVLGGYGTLVNDRYCGHQGLIVKLRDKGCVDWSKKIVDTLAYCGYGDIKKVHASPYDSSYYAAGSGFLLKLDKHGNFVWNNIYRPNEYSYVDPIAMASDSQGRLFLLNSAMDLGWMVSCLEKDGKVLWSKFLHIGRNPDVFNFQYTANPLGLTWLHGKLYVTGSASANNNYFNTLTRLDAGTGKTEWQRGYQTVKNPGSIAFGPVSAYGNMVMVAGTDGGGQGVFLMDTTGTIRKTIKASFTSSYAPHVTKARADSQGNIYIMQWTEATLNLQPYYYYYTNFVKVDTAFKKHWGLVYPRWNFNDIAMNSRDLGALGSDFGMAGSADWGSVDMRFLKVSTTADDITGYPRKAECNYYTNDYTLSTMPTTEVPLRWVVDSAMPLTAHPVTHYVVRDAHIESRYTCPDFVDSCQFLKLSGPVSGCSFSQTYTYQVHRNRKCALQPRWKLPKGATIRSQTDSTLTVQFPGFGVYGLSAEIASCTPVFDSVTVRIRPPTARLNLGKDTVICRQTSFLLQAGNDFVSYRWQDGSKDKSFTVAEPGLYWIEVTDSCGNLLRDSLRVDAYGDDQIDLGPDRVKCNGDTVRLQAPDGFMSYTWGPAYNVSATTGQTVVVNPLFDTAYVIRAEKQPGCFAYDTIRISVFHSPAINLGADRSICTGDSAVFSAGGGFAAYLWSSGQNTPIVTAKNAGVYSVVATTAEGCRSVDTVKVIQVFSLPRPSLDKNPALCEGESRILNPGPFAAYVWNDGSSNSSLTVNGRGTYAVKVTDGNGCKGSDTTAIEIVHPLPAGFLPPDTAICSYGSLELKPRNNFQQYLWSNSEKTKTTTIIRPGLYWLEVSDGNNCRGRDSVTVSPKDCLNGLYVPSAFTPNSDGRNDLFKPLLFGRVQRYHFAVYNRWGTAIYQATDPQKGWDGKVAGRPLEAGVFVWTCTYQLEGGTVQTAKGTVTLVR